MGGKLAVRAIRRWNAIVSSPKPGDHQALLSTRASGPEFTSGRGQRQCLGIRGGNQDDDREPEKC